MRCLVDDWGPGAWVLLIRAGRGLLIASSRGAERPSPTHPALFSQEWLSRFGYLPPADPTTGQLQTQEELAKAITAMQRFGGLETTGILGQSCRGGGRRLPQEPGFPQLHLLWGPLWGWGWGWAAPPPLSPGQDQGFLPRGAPLAYPPQTCVSAVPTHGGQVPVHGPS